MNKRNDIDVMVVGNDHYNTLNVVRALGSKGLKCGIVIISDNPKCMVLKSKWKYAGEACNQKDVITLLIEKYSHKDGLAPLIATDDLSAAFLDRHHDILKRHYIMPSCGDVEGKLTNFMDKGIQLRQAAKAGFHVPASIALDLGQWNESIPGNLRFPCIIKPEQSIAGSKQDFRICESSEELMTSLSELKGHIRNVLIQEYVTNDEVIVISGVRGFNGDTYVYGEINKYLKGNKLHNLGLCCMGRLDPKSELREKCIQLVNEIDYHGCFSIDVVRSSGVESKDTPRDYFMEMNLRSDGLFFFYTKAGINYPYIWYLCCKGEMPNVIPSSRPIYGMNEFLYLRERPSITMLKDFLKADTFSLFDIHDIKPFFYKILYNVKKQIPASS